MGRAHLHFSCDASKSKTYAASFLMCGPKEGRFSVLMAILHRVVVSNPVQDVSKDVGPMDTAPKELLQVRVEQRVASSMHCTKLRLAVPPRSFDGVGVQRWVIGIDEVQYRHAPIPAG